MRRILLLSLLLPLAATTLFSQAKTLTGTVTNAAGEPLPGATVMVKSTSVGTTTDALGNYSLELEDGHNVLVFSFLGYETTELEVNGRSVLDLAMTESASDLDQVLVVGFGSQSKRRVTNSIASVGEEVFKNVPVTDFQNALAGRMSGVVLSGSSGSSNSDVNIRIRGVGSISAGNQPLFVVDGLILSGRINAPYYNDQYSSLNSNPFVNLNPNDIESVEVLKDAAASAIYGSRGANGVILITTKSGKFGAAPKISLGYYAGFTEISKKFDVLNGKEYAAYWNHAAMNSGFDPAANPEMFYDVEAQPSSDWQDLGTRRGFLHETNASVSGGSKSTKYYFSGSFRDEDGYLLTDHLQRISFRANIDQMLGEKWTAGISLNPSRVRGRRPNAWQSPTYQSWYLPNVEAFDENGKSRTDIPYSSIGFTSGVQTPLNNLLTEWSRITSTQLLSSAYLNFSPVRAVSLKTEFAAEFTQLEELYKMGKNNWFGFPAGFGSAYNQQVGSFNWTNLATYKNTFGGDKHSFDATAGFNLTRETLTGLYVDGGSFADDRLNYLGAAAQFFTHVTNQTDAAFVGYLARLNYAFENKYLLTLSARYDGSSRFGSKNRFGFFPAASAGWILTEENFLNFQFLNFLKIRSSFGVAGNARIGDFASQGLVQFGQNYLDKPGLGFRSIENESLGWEKNVQWDAGLEFALLNNRIRGTLAYYVKDTKDLLLEVYAQIEKDLTRAATLLPAPSDTERGRANSFAATAYLARVAFQKRDYAAAANYAQIIAGNFGLNGSPSEFFRNEGSGEEIWAMVNSSSDANFFLVRSLHHDALWAKISGDLKRRGFAAIVPPAQLDAIENAGYQVVDLRADPGILTDDPLISADTAYTNKYEDFAGYSDDAPMARAAEFYLMRAEALAHTQGVNEESIELLNQIRRRSLRVIDGSGQVVPGSDAFIEFQAADFQNADELIAAIIVERRVELCFEGNYFHDLMRTKGEVYHWFSGVLTVIPYDADRLRLPIPQREMDANPSLVQNSGY